MTSPDAVQPLGAMLKISDLQEYLQVSQATAYRLKDSGEIPFYQIRGNIRFRVEDVERYVQSVRVAR